MHHFLVVFVALFSALARCNIILHAPEPVITPAPVPVDMAVDLLRRQGVPIDPVSLANILLTAFPESLREIAATNIPEVSRILWSEFLDSNTPSWFTALPSDIQEYLSYQYGPSSLEAETTATDDTSSSLTVTARSRSTDTSSIVSMTSAPTTTSSTDSSIMSSTALSSNLAPSSDGSNGATGLTLAQKIGIGLGVPLGVLAIAALILLCCCLSRRRSRRRRARDVDDRVPTPAFVNSRHRAPSMEQKWAPLPVPQGYSNRGRDSGYGNNSNNGGFHSGIGTPNGSSYHNGNSIGDETGFGNDNSPPEHSYLPAAAAGIGALPAARRSRGTSASRSRASLSSVRESPMEFTHEYAAAAVPAPPARRSRTSSMNGVTDSPTLGTGNGTSIQNGNGNGHRRSMDANGAGGLSALSPLNPSSSNPSTHDSDTHPAYRSSQDIPPMPTRPSFDQGHHNTPYISGFGTTKSNGYVSIATPAETHHQHNPISSAPVHTPSHPPAAPTTHGYTSIAEPSDTYHATSNGHGHATGNSNSNAYTHPYDGSWNGMQQAAHTADPATFEAHDWPLRDSQASQGSRWSGGSMGSKSERRPLWDGSVYEGT